MAFPQSTQHRSSSNPGREQEEQITEKTGGSQPARQRRNSLYFLWPSPKSPPTVRVAFSVKYSIMNWSQNVFW